MGPQLLEERRDGVVQLAVVQENYLWSKGYRQPILEEIFGSGWFIDNSEFGIETNGDLLIVTNAHVAKQAKSIQVLVPSLGQEPIIDPPKFVIFGGAVIMELTRNLVSAFLPENPTELVQYTELKNCLEPRVLISNIIPGSIAAQDETLHGGSLLKSFNGKTINSFDDVCSVLSTPPTDIWSIETQESLAVLPASEVMKNPEHNVYDWCVNGKAKTKTLPKIEAKI